MRQRKLLALVREARFQVRRQAISEKLIAPSYRTLVFLDNKIRELTNTKFTRRELITMRKQIADVLAHYEYHVYLRRQSGRIN